MTYEELRAIEKRDARCKSARRQPSGNTRRDGVGQVYRDRHVLLGALDRERWEVAHLMGEVQALREIIREAARWLRDPVPAALHVRLVRLAKVGVDPELLAELAETERRMLERDE